MSPKSEQLDLWSNSQIRVASCRTTSNLFTNKPFQLEKLDKMPILLFFFLITVFLFPSSLARPYFFSSYPYTTQVPAFSWVSIDKYQHAKYTFSASYFQRQSPLCV